jgi:hypothetical protein
VVIADLQADAADVGVEHREGIAGLGGGRQGQDEATQRANVIAMVRPWPAGSEGRQREWLGQSSSAPSEGFSCNCST